MEVYWLMEDSDQEMLIDSMIVSMRLLRGIPGRIELLHRKSVDETYPATIMFSSIPKRSNVRPDHSFRLKLEIWDGVWWSVFHVWQSSTFPIFFSRTRTPGRGVLIHPPRAMASVSGPGKLATVHARTTECPGNDQAWPTNQRKQTPTSS